MRLPDIPKPSGLALIILAVLLAGVLIARAVIDRPRPPLEQAGRAILAGEAQAREYVAQEAQDRDLTDDEAAAGQIWAKAHGATDPTECPLDPPQLRRGCVAFVAARAK
ncbi:MAG: hypothetical protein ABI306_07195 [Caulobacteraceae bacterium]